ncbi:DUF2829 domain-containing protein [Rhizobium phage RHph_N1_15]|nr:DUF2829 domain-containing protein [Rhizobium phage RHph_N1_10]QIG69232.1 DUF2829 domain-containing protein [Rhizobium phage RHph_N1_15]QIG75092.1 DUF2829 domain-containing protein [Rhizobium phage RHph_N2_6]
MNLGEALEAVKNGKRAARAGWNGKKMFVYLMPGSAPLATEVKTVDGVDLINGVRTDLFTDGDTGTAIRMPSFCLRAADGSSVVGWLASQTDMAAEDWELV